MKNKYEIKDDHVCIYFSSPAEIIIDIEDLEKVASIPGTWTFSGKVVKNRINGEYIYLSRVVLGINSGKNLRIGFLNGNIRDYRRQNLIHNAVSDLQIKRTKPNVTNRATGVRNVYKTAYGDFGVRISVCGKRIYLGTFGTLQEASAVVDQFRQEQIDKLKQIE